MSLYEKPVMDTELKSSVNSEDIFLMVNNHDPKLSEKISLELQRSLKRIEKILPKRKKLSVCVLPPNSKK